MVESEPLPVLHLLSLALAVAALLWLRRLSKQVEVLQRRLERVEPQKHASPHETTAATKQTVGKTEATYAVPTRGAPQTDRGTIARLKGKLKRKAREPSREEAIRKPNWMVWLGGVSVALAGVFLVKYSIDQGLLTPWTRVVLAICTGFAMHALAEWLPIRTGGRHPAFSALAAAGSVTLCAATLAALHLYELIPPLAAFAFLAFVSVATTSLALKHGPVFAALGMIGSYAVPLLVGGDSGRIVGVLLYTLIVSATVLLVIRYVYRAWLWWGMVAGGILWWLLSMGGNDADGYRGFYLALLAAEILWLPSLDWWRRSGVANALGAGWRASADRGTGYSDAIGASIRSALIALTLMQGFSIATEPFSVLAAISWAPLVGVLFLAARFRSQCVSLPWLSLAIHGAAWIATALKIDDFQIRWVATIPEVKSGLPVFAAAMGTAYPLLARWNLRGSESVSLWASLAAASPVCWLGIAFAVATDREPSWEWALVSAVLGLIYWLVGRKLFRDGLYSIASWTILGLSGAYSLAAVAAFRDAGLTLALAVQAVPLAWLAVRHKASSVEWMTKAVLGAIVVRLTLNPWLPSYSEGSYWILWTYGGSTLACLAAGWTARPLPKLRRWIEAAAAHLLVLTCWLGTRQWLYSGNAFAEEYGLPEAAINTATWGALGLIYYWRSQVSEQISAVYRWASRVVLGMSLWSYALALLFLNPLWGHESIGETRVWNLLLLAYGAPVVLAYLARRFYEPFGARLAGKVAALALFAFVSLEVRHLWQQALDLALPASDGEMATYSVVWLCMAVAAILSGGLRFGPGVYRAGMALLLLTTCKVFLVDMSGLTGLLRAGSFMGLGLSLLGLAYLHQRFGQVNSPSAGTDS